MFMHSLSSHSKKHWESNPLAFCTLQNTRPGVSKRTWCTTCTSSYTLWRVSCGKSQHGHPRVIVRSSNVNNVPASKTKRNHRRNWVQTVTARWTPRRTAKRHERRSGRKLELCMQKPSLGRGALRVSRDQECRGNVEENVAGPSASSITTWVCFSPTIIYICMCLYYGTTHDQSFLYGDS